MSWYNVGFKPAAVVHCLSCGDVSAPGVIFLGRDTDETPSPPKGACYNCIGFLERLRLDKELGTPAPPAQTIPEGYPRMWFSARCESCPGDHWLVFEERIHPRLLDAMATHRGAGLSLFWRNQVRGHLDVHHAPHGDDVSKSGQSGRSISAAGEEASTGDPGRPGGERPDSDKSGR